MDDERLGRRRRRDDGGELIDGEEDLDLEPEAMAAGSGFRLELDAMGAERDAMARWLESEEVMRAQRENEKIAAIQVLSAG